MHGGPNWANAPMPSHRSAVAFLHFSEERRAAEPHKPPGLDGCRIHPEQYPQARKMCFDAMVDDEDVDETDDKLNEAVDWAMSSEGLKRSADGAAMVSALDELELEEFAEHLREEGINIGKDTLEDIKASFVTPSLNAYLMNAPLLDLSQAELVHPYRDTRGHCGLRGPLEVERLFELLTAETEATLRPGSLVFGARTCHKPTRMSHPLTNGCVRSRLLPAKFVRFESGRMIGGTYHPGAMHVLLQSGLPGTISEDRISDKWDRVPTIEGHGRDGRTTQIAQARALSKPASRVLLCTVN